MKSRRDLYVYMCMFGDVLLLLCFIMVLYHHHTAL